MSTAGRINKDFLLKYQQSIGELLDIKNNVNNESCIIVDLKFLEEETLPIHNSMLAVNDVLFTVKNAGKWEHTIDSWMVLFKQLRLWYRYFIAKHKVMRMRYGKRSNRLWQLKGSVFMDKLRQNIENLTSTEVEK